MALGSTVCVRQRVRCEGPRSQAVEAFTNDRQNREEINVYKHLDTFTVQDPKRRAPMLCCMSPCWKTRKSHVCTYMYVAAIPAIGLLRI